VLILALILFGQTSRAASFTWDPSPDQATGKVLGYHFYYSSQSFTSLPPDVANNAAFKILTVTNGTSVTIPEMVVGQTYYVTVAAFGANNVESLPSTIFAYTIPAAPAKPAPPANLIVKSQP
jgi:hypothetical protein